MPLPPRDKHIEMMMHFSKWPLLSEDKREGVLPLERYPATTQLFQREQGFLVKERGKAHVDPTVHIGNIWLYGMGRAVERLKTYQSFEDLYDDGWRVD